MGNTLYLECYSGISGDMTVGALLDLGADQKVLEQALKSLSVAGFETRISRVQKAGLDVCDFQVILDREHENHDHDMEYLYGPERDHHHHEHGGLGEGHDHHHHEHGGLGEGHDHHHEHGGPGEGHDHHHYEHGGPGEGHDHHHHEYDGSEKDHAHHHHGPHEHRGLPEILDIIAKAEITDKARETAARIFTILAEAEAKAHGLPADQVHFHEVGAVDSIADIVAVAVCLDNLGITEVIVPELYEGRGFVRCQHGVIPVPVPAVVNIAQAHGLKLRLTGTEGELVTPTGAAIVAAICTSDRLPEKFSVKKTGIGAGKRTYDRPSMLRAMLIERETDAETSTDVICKMETNIDDCSAETLGYTMERLFEAGARDVFYTPIFMKKNRPAYQLSVLCSLEDTVKLERIIFRETTAIGIRKTEMKRTILKRELLEISTPLGQADVKKCILPNGEERYYPEYESAAKLAKEHGIRYQEAYRLIQSEAENGKKK